MKNKSLLLFSSFLFLLILATQVGYSQLNGKISGKVSDSKSGETLIGLTVKITGATLGASNDI